MFRARASLSGLGDDTGPGASPIGSLEDIALESALADRFTGTYGGRIAESLTEQDLPVDSFPPGVPGVHDGHGPADVLIEQTHRAGTPASSATCSRARIVRSGST